MSSNISPQMPYLLSSRKFPSDPQEMIKELEKMYLEVANAVNQREIAVYDQTSIMTGEQWFQTIPQTLDDPKTKRQTFRQVYSFSDANLTFNHNLPTVSLFTNIYGTGRNSTKFFPIPYVSTTLANQIQIDVTTTQVIITKGGGAPTITNGIIVLEFLREE